MAAKPAEEAPQGETLKYQTWVLKVLIHCDGCKRRVKKILQGIDGVYTTEVDSLLHKVTVTGNVDAETLIKRLSRSGRVVELWPEKPPEKKDNKKSGKSNKGGAGDANKEKEDQKNSEPDSDGGGSNEGSKDAPGEDSDKEGHSYECEEGGGGGEGGKKKKKKKKKKNKEENGGSASATANNNGGAGEEISKVEALVPSNLATSFTPKDLISPPIQHAYPYPPQVYYPPPPAYGLSYNTAYPVSSTASYYVGAPIMPMHAYTTTYSRLPPPAPSSDPIKHYVEDEDEYESGGYCSIM